MGLGITYVKLNAGEDTSSDRSTSDGPEEDNDREDKLDQAEQRFAAALRSVHMKESNTDQHWKEAEPLHKLSGVYLKKGMLSKEGDDFTKAAALCHAALARLESSKKEDKYGIKQTLLKIIQSFVFHVLNSEETVDANDIAKHRSMLQEDRDFINEEMKRIEEEIDPYSLDNDDPKIREVEKTRAEANQVLFQRIVQQRSTFISSLVDDCISVMGPPPCKYAMIGLGSQATGLVTPYSDLEFAILIEEETDNNIEYFRNLTHYLHLKVINLGETILPAMGIKSLNDFDSGNVLDNWYYDSVTPRGFSFDGAMPHACKTPLGRGKTCGLIHTPTKMSTVLNDDVEFYLKEGYHLATILGNVCLITGEQDLVDEYSSLWSQKLQQNDGNVSLLKATMEENATKFTEQMLSDKLLNVKKEIYRFSSLAVSSLALVHNMQPTTIWETIEELKTNGIVDSANAHHLMVMVSISAELRLRTYINNHGQVENMSALSSMSTDTDIGETLKVFYYSNQKQVMRYYNTAKPFQDYIAQLDSSQPSKELPILFDNSFKMRARIFKGLCAYKESKDCMILAADEHTLDQAQIANASEDEVMDKAAILVNLIHSLGVAYQDLGDHSNAALNYEISLTLKRKLCAFYGESSEETDKMIATILDSLGMEKINLREYAQAVDNLEQSLQMRLNIHGNTTAHPDIASSYHHLGLAWEKLGDYRMAINYFEQALKMEQTVYSKVTVPPSIASLHDSLGSVYIHIGDHRKAIKYHEQSLQIRLRIYGAITAHPAIARSFVCLGDAWNGLGDLKTAIRYYERALQMRWEIYGENATHPDIANLLNNLGYAWDGLGNHREAIRYFKQSLKMKKSFYGETTAHRGVILALENLGNMWRKLGDDSKANGYFVESMSMRQSLYDETYAKRAASALMKFFKT
ncbi:uncharacterized protein LOC144865528 [Branchiostoma floridae x Branchiostoma japonicum]